MAEFVPQRNKNHTTHHDNLPPEFDGAKAAAEPARVATTASFIMVGIGVGDKKVGQNVDDSTIGIYKNVK